MAQFTCIGCGYEQKSFDKFLGREARCPKCRTVGKIEPSPAGSHYIPAWFPAWGNIWVRWLVIMAPTCFAAAALGIWLDRDIATLMLWFCLAYLVIPPMRRALSHW